MIRHNSHALKLKDPTAFAEALIQHAIEPGLGSLSKRDIELLMYYLLERDGAISRKAGTYDVARSLNLPLARAKTYRRDAHARWRGVFSDSKEIDLKEVLKSVLGVEALDAAVRHAGKAAREDGYVPVWIEHPADRVDFEQAILDAKGIPKRGNHPDVLLVRFDVLVLIAERHLEAQDVRAAAKALKALAPSAEEIPELLRKDVKSIRWSDVRGAAGGLAIKIGTGAIDLTYSTLLANLFKGLS